MRALHKSYSPPPHLLTQMLLFTPANNCAFNSMAVPVPSEVAAEFCRKFGGRFQSHDSAVYLSNYPRQVPQFWR